MNDDHEEERRNRVDWTDYESVSVAVVVTVADRLNADPVSMPPLYDAVDPESLDVIVHGRRGFDRTETNRVVFEYADHCVTIYGDGTLRVEPASAERS